MRIECTASVEPREWDEAAEQVGGGFFHCHAYAAYESARPNVEPLFVRALDERGECVGVAVGTIESPRFWPFSRYCRRADFGALPAARSAEVARAILAAVEEELSDKGIFLVEQWSRESPGSAEMLSSLGYALEKERAEFYIHLSRPLEEIWAALTSQCRNHIRKATKLGVQTSLESGSAGLSLLYGFQAESLQRHGVEFRAPHEDGSDANPALLQAGRARLAVSYFDGVPTNAAMFGVFGRKAYSLYSGASSAGRKNGGPAHLLWTMVERLKAEGCSVLNLGGAAAPAGKDDPAYGLFAFKRDFGAAIVSQPAGARTISPLGAFLNGLQQRLKRAAARQRAC